MKTPYLTPLDYPLSPSAQSRLPTPQLPEPRQTGTPPQVTGPYPSEQPGPPSPLLGKAPPLPLSLPMIQRLKKNPALLQEWQKGLNPVTSTPPPSLRLPGKAAPVGGTWTQGPSAPGFPPLSNPLLMTDGTVIAHVSCAGTWWKLTPDFTGSYINGSWAQIASLPLGYEPRFFGSAVLPDGRVEIEGGEYNVGCTPVRTNLGAIYDPLHNTWTSVTPPAGWSQIGDAQSAVLANGTYMQADCCEFPAELQALFNPSSLTWTPTGTGKADGYDEEGWTLLPNGSVLTVDAFTSGGCGTSTERYSPVTGTWTSAGNTPAILADCGAGATFELGPQVLRPDGTAVAFGGTTCGSSCLPGDTSVITPSAIFNSATSLWSAGPNIPQVSGNNYTLADAPAALLPNGNVLFAASPNYNAFVTPTHFFEVSATANTIAQVAEPTDASIPTSYQWNFLVLPTGQVMALETDFSNVWIYTPSGSPNAAWKPAVTSAPASLVSGGTFTLSGTQLNGLSQGAAYGDDVQAATNYPIIKIVSATGHVVFGRSFNFSTMTVAPAAAGSASFTMPENVEPGPSSLFSIANGIASAPVSLNLERSVYAKPADFNADGKSDILWRDMFGTIVIWEMNGGAVLAQVGGQVVSKDWSIAGTGDFNSDGKTDILWRNRDGAVVIWEMNGGAVLANVNVGEVSNDWTIAGTGDFFGTGHSNCILWRNTKNGSVVIWEMNGGTVLKSVGGQVVSSDWTIAGTGDFNSDGKTDILWRNTNGTVVIWEMNGGTVLAIVGNQVVGNGWIIDGTGDFFGTGHSNCILWRNSNNGTVLIWEMNGGTILKNVSVGGVSNDWIIAGTGDFNGDGKTDILWRNTNGTVVIWEMNGGAVLAQVGGQGVSAFQWTLVQ